MFQHLSGICVVIVSLGFVIVTTSAWIQSSRERNRVQWRYTLIFLIFMFLSIASLIGGIILILTVPQPITISF